MRKNKSKLVSIIIVNFNGRDYLKDLLFSLSKSTYKNFEVILVDNASEDDSIFLVKKIFPKVKVIKNKTNLGFVGGNNVGLKKAKGEFILLLNNDTRLTPRFLEYLVLAVEDKKIAVVQPKIIFSEDKKLQSGGSYLTNFGFLYHWGYGKNPNLGKYNKKREIFSANGACMLIKREVIEKVGLFDKDFFLYFEETDFCWRVRLAGYKVIYEPKAKIFHKGKQTSQKLSKFFVNYHSFKNRISSIIKNAGDTELIKILPTHLVLCFGILFIYLAMFKIQLVFSVISAIFWNIENLKKTLAKRKYIQHILRKVSDREIMPVIKKRVRLSYLYYLFKGLEYYKD